MFLFSIQTEIPRIRIIEHKLNFTIAEKVIIEVADYSTKSTKELLTDREKKVL